MTQLNPLWEASLLRVSAKEEGETGSMDGQQHFGQESFLESFHQETFLE